MDQVIYRSLLLASWFQEWFPNVSWAIKSLKDNVLEPAAEYVWDGLKGVMVWLVNWLLNVIDVTHVLGWMESVVGWLLQLLVNLLPESVGGYLAGVQEFFAGTTMSKMIRVGLWFADIFMFADVIIAVATALFWWWVLVHVIRFGIWIWAKVWGST